MSTDELKKAALEARKNAYAPYSKFAVGAALLTKSGEVFSGCNVENVSLGLTICAERAALAAAVAHGQREFVAVAIVTDSKEPAVPCGACRQVLAEFNPMMKITSSTLKGREETWALADLLPRPRQGILEDV
jgi:cytidine deaminase